MNLLKFFYVLSYQPLTFLNEDLKDKYKYYYFKVVLDIIKHPQIAAYTRNYLYVTIKYADKQLIDFISNNTQHFSATEQEFFEGLVDLMKNIKRYLSNTPANIYPHIMDRLTTEDLKTYIKNYRKVRTYSENPQIFFLKTEEYVNLAKKLQKEADVFLKQND